MTRKCQHTSELARGEKQKLESRKVECAPLPPRRPPLPPQSLHPPRRHHHHHPPLRTRRPLPPLHLSKIQSRHAECTYAEMFPPEARQSVVSLVAIFHFFLITSGVQVRNFCKVKAKQQS